MKCCNVDHHCEWVGTVATLDEHVATCEFTLIPCPKQCKDENSKVKRIIRKNLDTHLKEDCPNRDYACEYCGEKGTYAHITQVHDEECEMKILPCPIPECKIKMQRWCVQRHVSTECEYNIIPCKFKGLGCDVKLKKKDMRAHEKDDKIHVHMAIDMIAKLECDLRDTKERTNKLEKDIKDAFTLTDTLNKDVQIALDNIATLKNGQAVKLKLKQYQQMKDQDECLESPSYYTSSNGYRMSLRVHVNGYDEYKGTHVIVFAIILKGKFDTELKWPFLGTITFTLVNQLEDKNHKTVKVSMTSEDDAQIGRACGAALIRHSKLGYDPDKQTQYLKDDILYFRMSVEVADCKPWLE